MLRKVGSFCRRHRELVGESGQRYLSLVLEARPECPHIVAAKVQLYALVAELQKCP
jgi:hypothetical protein